MIWQSILATFLSVASLAIIGLLIIKTIGMYWMRIPVYGKILFFAKKISYDYPSMKPNINPFPRWGSLYLTSKIVWR